MSGIAKQTQSITRQARSIPCLKMIVSVEDGTKYASGRLFWQFENYLTRAADNVPSICGD
jgi:hypothetical protein